MNIILLGPPLAGKGVQGQLLSEELKIPRLSVGALIRKQYKENSPFGIEASKYMIYGKAIPGDLLITIIKGWIEKHHNGFILDNLIRTEDQLNAYKQYAIKSKIKIDKVINLTIPESIILRRLKTRISEHQQKNRVREDENADALLIRCKVYYKSINKIIDYFKKNSLVYKISGNNSVLKVNEDIMDILGKKK